MFSVKWVMRGKENEPIASETFTALGSETVVVACQTRLTAMREKYPERPPDGFLVFDRRGKKIHRWFSPTL